MSWSDRADDPLPPDHPDRPPPRWRVSDLAKSLARTWAPMAVGAVVTWLARRWGVVVPEDLGADASIALAAGVMALYYYVARWLEQRHGAGLPARIARWLGRWLLGGAIPAPSYPRQVGSTRGPAPSGVTTAVRPPATPGG